MRFLFLLALALPLAAQPRAKNVVLFLGDAGGIPTLNAASILGYGEPQKLYIQQMPHVGLSDTSTASSWVSDSAAGMTAVVTGRKTHNGVVSQGPDAVRGEKDGEPLKTILEYAEERALSTGVVTNMNAADATPAACYAHVNNRRNFSSIFQQLVKPRFGDGVDVLIGAGRRDVAKALAEDGLTLDGVLSGTGWKRYESVSSIPKKLADRRAVALFDSRDEFSLPEAVSRALDILDDNPKGFFLMVEGDMHTNNVRAGLERMLELDRIIRTTAERLRGTDTLILYTADHSFDLRVDGGSRDKPLLEQDDSARYSEDRKSYQSPAGRMDNSHTGEEVPVTGEGPGAERIRGFLPNTEIFHVMMDAFGWQSER